MNRRQLSTITVAAAKSASKAFAAFTGRRSSINLIHSELVSRTTNHPTLKPEERVTGIYLPVRGAIRGAAFLCFPELMAKNLSSLLAGPKNACPKVSPLGASALKEVGNVICGNYLSVVANQLKADVSLGLPRLSHDMFGALFGDVIGRLSRETSTPIMIVEVQISLQGEVVTGFLFLSLDTERMMDSDARA